MRLLLVVMLAACGSSSNPGITDGGSGDGGGGDGPPGVELPACGPHNCAGCCAGEVCQSGTSDDSCGAGGAACQACGGFGECDAQAICMIAADSRWTLVVESAQVSAVNQGGTGWDGDDPDVYVHIDAADRDTNVTHDLQSAGIESTTPTWNQTLATDLRGAALDGMLVTLFDEDGAGNPDDLIGECYAFPTLRDLNVGTVTLTCERSPSTCTAGLQCNAGWTLRYRLDAESAPRPGAAPFARVDLPVHQGPIGACEMTITDTSIVMGNTLVSQRIEGYDEHGRLVRHEGYTNGVRDDAQIFGREVTCDGAVGPGVPCYEPPDRLFFSEYEASSTGFRVARSAGLRFEYDSLGREVRYTQYSIQGENLIERNTVHGMRTATLDNLTWTFDERGRMTNFDMVLRDGIVKLHVDTDANGLPVHWTQLEAPPIYGTTESIATYVGPGCALRAPISWTNGPIY